ncbi:DCC1-like thiol-disulfide oxidoreductase family protein [Lysinibacillus xylanilyticus]|uniref:thiol-disulfide oxidoreductase DCC family protein n=1 Tax=Lysinibacillus xylanilyticus TaxID=582475 RepID=UPI002B24011D|nr:DCC1-like thiol-disulfide oxidoreductase family protein [Lysinibacillus xylanilyticus]MEB2300323.1 DCC1-like thiol-disulfide oxidoreductase family protein [Lysinibacillus xylanilyticus]
MELLIYDGDCNMCSSFIRFIVRFNRNPDLKITDLNDERIFDYIDSKIDSIIFVKNNQKYVYSDAIILLLASSNRLFIPILILRLLPKRLRNYFYKIVARNRKQLFNNNSCRIPTEKERKMFL